MADQADYFAAAAAITAAMIQRKSDNVDVRPEDAAKLFWQVREALHKNAPKGKASATGLHM